MSDVRVAGVPARTLMYPFPNVPPFGIYHQAIPEWQEYTYDSLIEAQQPVRNYVDSLHLPEGSGERFEINDAYALTYVERRETKDHPELDDIDLDQVIERVGNLSAGQEVISVPIMDLEWRKSHIVAPFDQDTYEFQCLLDYQWHIERILHEAGLSESLVNRPHHTSLSSIRFQLETKPLHTRLFRSPRQRIVDMLSRQMTAAGIDTVELGGAIVGNNYTTPFAPGSWMTEQHVEVVYSWNGEDMTN